CPALAAWSAREGPHPPAARHRKPSQRQFALAQSSSHSPAFSVSWIPLTPRGGSFIQCEFRRGLLNNGGLAECLVREAEIAGLNAEGFHFHVEGPVVRSE